MSGREPNSFFYNQKGEGFIDLSNLSGADHLADGRSFAWLDYDRDGWTDLVLVNSNNPQLVLYRNELGDQLERTSNSVAVKLRGGNRTARSSAVLSNRDGFGAQILVNAGSLRLHREVRCGDGFAAQNSRVSLIGMGAEARADTITVEWPSGKTQTARQVEAGSLVTFDEGVEGAAAVGVEPYRRNVERAGAPIDHGVPVEFQSIGDRRSLRLLIAITTECAGCKAAHPQIAHLATRWREVEVVGVSVEVEDTPARLQRYEEDEKPPYRIISRASPADRDLVRRLLEARLGQVTTPATVVLDVDGRVRGVFAGVPSASEVGKTMVE